MQIDNLLAEYLHSGRYDLVFKVKSVASEETWNKLLHKRTYGINYTI